MFPVEHYRRWESEKRAAADAQVRILERDVMLPEGPMHRYRLAFFWNGLAHMEAIITPQEGVDIEDKVKLKDGVQNAIANRADSYWSTFVVYFLLGKQFCFKVRDTGVSGTSDNIKQLRTHFFYAHPTLFMEMFMGLQLKVQVLRARTSEDARAVASDLAVKKGPPPNPQAAAARLLAIAKGEKKERGKVPASVKGVLLGTGLFSCGCLSAQKVD